MKNVELQFPMWKEVFFFFPNSLEIRKGQIVGYFLVVENKDVNDPTEDDIKYYYQVAYYNPVSVEGKEDVTEDRLMLATKDASEIFLDEETATEKFIPLKRKALEEAIEDHNKSIEGANTNIAFNQEILDGATGELKRLQEELDKM